MPGLPYDDGAVRFDGHELTIRWYYPWGSKRIGVDAVRTITELPLVGINALRRWRIWGSGDLVHWWNLDPRRPRKTTALILDIGKRVRPVITPHRPAELQDLINRARP